MLSEIKKSVKRREISLEGIFQEGAQTTYNICTTCMSYDTCTFPINMSRPILHCEEFKPYAPRPSVTETVGKTRMEKTAEKTAETQYIGLCKNCELKQSCTHSKPGKYVLNCEEYQ
jgi:hypothetical protein